MLSDYFQFYKDKKNNSYMLFGKQNNKEHADMFSLFRMQHRGEFRIIITHFLNKLELKQDAEQIIKQNLSSFYIWKNQKQEVEVYFIDGALTQEIKYKNSISDQTYQQFYDILLSLSNLNIFDAQQNITFENFYKQLDQLYLNVAKLVQKEQKQGNTDQYFKSLKIKTRNSICLRPSGDIIKLEKINNDISNYNNVNIYISTRLPFCNPSQEDQEYLVYSYQGQIDQQTFLPHGKGILNCEGAFEFKGKFMDGMATGRGTLDLKKLKQKLEGDFQNGFKHGEFITTNPNQTTTVGYYQNNMKQGVFTTKKQNGSVLQELYYKNDQIVKKNECKYNETMISTRYLASHKEISINNHFFSSLTEDKWVNQMIVDYYLRILSDYYKNVSNAKILLFNTAQSQDLFTNQIGLLDHSSLKLHQKYQEIINQYQKYDRLIFILNDEQTHFLVIVYQKQSLYMLNSYTTIKDQKLLSTVASIFPIELNKQQIQVEQQKNNHDCSLYSIYNVMLQYKYYNVDVDKIDYKVSFKYIKKLRLHLKNVISNDYAHIILHQK